MIVGLKNTLQFTSLRNKHRSHVYHNFRKLPKASFVTKELSKKKILSRALAGSDYHFIGTRCLCVSLELLVKPTQLLLLQIHFEIAFKRHWKHLGTGAPPSSEGVTPLNSANTATISSLSFSPSSARNDCSLMTFWDFICDAATHLEWARMRSSSYKHIQGAQRSFAILT